VVSSLEEVDAVLAGAEPIDGSTPAATLRSWRTDLVRASVVVSYAIGVLSLDAEILSHPTASPKGDELQSLIDDLPGMLASGWVGGGWSLSPDASVSIAAAEVAIDQSQGLLGLHAELASSDLSDPDQVRDLAGRVEERRRELTERRDLLEGRIRQIQEAVLAQYGSGAASVDDWLN
jgi:hypothetical protein